MGSGDPSHLSGSGESPTSPTPLMRPTNTFAGPKDPNGNALSASRIWLTCVLTVAGGPFALLVLKGTRPRTLAFKVLAVTNLIICAVLVAVGGVVHVQNGIEAQRATRFTAGCGASDGIAGGGLGRLPGAEGHGAGRGSSTGALAGGDCAPAGLSSLNRSKLRIDEGFRQTYKCRGDQCDRFAFPPGSKIFNATTQRYEFIRPKRELHKLRAGQPRYFSIADSYADGLPVQLPPAMMQSSGDNKNDIKRTSSTAGEAASDNGGPAATVIKVKTTAVAHGRHGGNVLTKDWVPPVLFTVGAAYFLGSILFFVLYLKNRRKMRERVLRQAADAARFRSRDARIVV